MRAISNVVDITNYVMLLTGQPLHAFDLDRLAGGRIVVRRAGDGESITTLDGQERTLDSSMLAICDAERPAVIAGIFGAEFAEVGPGTTRVLLEAATFDGPTILNTSLALGLRSESSGRFEKGLPPQLPPRAMAIASRLLVELCGARLVPGTLDEHAPLPAPATCRCAASASPASSGWRCAPDDAAAILARLGCEVRVLQDGVTATIPFERASDLTREIDLVEEVGRIRGLNDIPAILPRIVANGRLTPSQARERRLARLAADLGLSETISYRQVPESDLDALRIADDDPRRALVRMAHPMSAEMAVMRRSMLPGPAARGRAQPEPPAHGRGPVRDRPHLRAARGRPGRRAPLPGGRALRARGRRRRLARPAAPGGRLRRHRPRHRAGARGRGARGAAPQRRPLLPSGAPGAPGGRRRRHRLGGRDAPAGAARVRGRRAPWRRWSWTWTRSTAPRRRRPGTRTSSRCRSPTATWPWSCPRACRAAELLDAARRAGGALLREVRVFDRYAGEQVGEGHVSLALRLTLADPGRTLTDEEIEGAVARVRDALEARGARLRG